MHSKNCLCSYTSPQNNFLVRCLVVLASSLLLPCSGLADDRFESDNQSQEVRSPVLEEKILFDGPRQIQRGEIDGWTVHRSDDLENLRKLMAKDALVLGKVESIYIPSNQNKVILNFGRDFRKCFKAVIDIRDFEKWGTKDPKEIGKMFDGKNVVVDGLVSSHQELPQIVVTLPHQLRLLKSK